MDNEPLSALTHLLAALLSVAGLIVLLVQAAPRSAWHVVGVAIFGGSLILLYSASTIYHFFTPGKAREVFRRLDHSFIYILIAGTYTPICLTLLRGPWGWSLLGLVWGLAIIGVVVKSVNLPLPPWLSTTIYLLIGWLALIAIVPIARAFPPEAVFWLILGGVFYSVGTIFFALESRLPRKRHWGMHETWHVMVILGSASHFWLIAGWVV